MPGIPDNDELTRRINDEKIAAINRFASVVSHELKNPLASLKNISYFLNKVVKTDDEKVQRMIGMLATELDRMNLLITELLDLSRIKKVNKTAAKLHELAEQAIAAANLNDSIRLEKNLEPVDAVVDRDWFRRLIINLLTNARDAMPEGGELAITINSIGNSINIVVKDTGSGMDTDTLSHAFDPLFTTKTKVLGLGLTVAREIVNIHYGTIALESEKGKGTTVRVVLPATPPPQ